MNMSPGRDGGGEDQRDEDQQPGAGGDDVGDQVRAGAARVGEVVWQWARQGRGCHGETFLARATDTRDPGGAGVSPAGGMRAFSFLDQTVGEWVSADRAEL